MKKSSEEEILLRKKLKIKSLIYLAFFIIFLILAISTGAVSDRSREYKAELLNKENQKNSETVKDVELTYFEKQKILYDGNYNYEFNISGEVNLNYTGKSTRGIRVGYKETTDEIVKYKWDNGKTYLLKGEEEIEYEELYEGVDRELFQFESLFNRLNGDSALINRDNDETIYVYSNIDSSKVTVFTTKKNIKKIEIESIGIKYEFSFDY